jgi:hypothetical protein
MKLRIACLAASLLFVHPAAAEDAFLNGVYSTPEGCAALKAKKQKSGDFLFVSATGIEGTDLTCEFVQVFPRKSSPGWTAISFCEDSDSSYPALFSILPLSKTSLHLGTLEAAAAAGDDDTAPAAAADDDDDGLDDDYQLCDTK